MSVTQAHSFDFGAEIVSPLLSRAECRLPANITAGIVRGDDAAFALGDGTVRVRRTVTAQQARYWGDGETVVARHEGAATFLEPFRRGLITAGQDGKIWRLASVGAAPIPVLDFGDRWVDTLAVNERAGLIAAACGPTLVLVREDGSGIAEVSAFPSTISGLAFDKDGRRIAVSHLDGVTILSAETAEREHRLTWKGSHTGVS